MVDTAMTTHEASSSSSSKSKLWNYDVFLSFSGVDTRNGFTGHLHAALTDRGYQAYIDEDDLERGEEIKEELFRAIEEARISIIVFSKSYVDSSWCLDELVKIMECRYKLGRRVLPIFYHIDPSHVRKQNGDFAQAFQKHEEGIREEKDDKEREAKQERVKQWRRALTEAANLSGQHLQITDNGREAKLIREIVGKIITEWLPSENELNVAKHPVGINSRVQDIINHLSDGGSNGVIMVGIWGMGGLGKTTAAKAIYNQIHRKFQFKSFLADVSDTTSKHGLVYLQEILISDILKQKSQISSVDGGISLIKQHLQRRRVLVIMDNIDEVEQLNAIAGNHDWFGPGSRIIITTRDEHLLKQVDKIYPAEKLDNGEALVLFSWHAFGNRWPNEGYLELSKKVVSYCGGSPLALEVLGSFLIKRTIAEWRSQLEKLERTPHGKIIKPLRISFEGLDDTQKAIFLDISCFFIGWDKDYVAKVLDGCGFFATVGISVLRERCLVTVEDNMLNMHDLLREMARVIISEKSPDHTERWSRLWNPREVTNVLTNKSGTEEVEGLALDFSDLWLQSSNKSSFSTVAFANMKKLRLLRLKNVQLNGKYKHLPKELIWLCWRKFPLESIPDDFFNQPRLAVLDMQHSKLVQVWKGFKLLQKLKIINLSYSRFLIKSPDFSQLPNLEELILEGCGNLSEIHPSIGHLKRLSLVNLTSCYRLISLPRDFYELKSVETLYLNQCSKLSELHEDLGEMISLRILEVELTVIRQVPPSIVGLKNLTRLSLRLGGRIHLHYSLHGLNSLRELDLSFCNFADDEIPKDLGSLISLQDLHLQGNNFHTLPNLSGLSKLETLWLSGCRNLHTIPDLPTNLKFLYAFGCPALKTMPNFSEMSNMRELNVSASTKLTEVPGLDKSLNSMTWIDMKRCTNLTADFRKNILQGWNSCGFGGIFLHGKYVPDWFEFVNDSNKVSFDIPPSDGRNFEGLTLFCVHGPECIFYHPQLHVVVTIINNTKRIELQACIGILDWEDVVCEDNYLWQGQLSNNKLNLQGGDKVDIIFEIPRIHDVRRTGVNLVWDKPMKENMHDLDKAGYVLKPTSRLVLRS
ncbi:disease resistance protein RPV1-like [Pyrus communis]|uniref:disease resistance protein RPV1-like n=1 Tax=Pyrus communis TaxID=23211 RepID=UPI0035C0658E